MAKPQITCTRCCGTGGADETCGTCNGKGCNLCNQRGTIWKDCLRCHGTKKEP